MQRRGWLLLAVIGSLTWLPPRAPGADKAAPIQVQETDDYVQIDTDALQARIRKRGYVSGIEKQTFLDKKTGARDLGFGLHIMDFLLAPGWKDDEYTHDPKVHGNLPKHYVEGPQICTQAKVLKPEVIRGEGFVAVRLRYQFTQPAKDMKAGSTWEQTLVFQPGLRYILSGERITSVNDVDDLFYRIDMPGHIRHKGSDTFAQVYLSYLPEPIPASAFDHPFAPDARFLYQRRDDKVPERIIRAYQIKQDGKPGPWLAGMTLDPAEVSEAWCHERGYVCFIEELHRRKVKAGETFGAAYVVGYFDDIPQMEKTYDRYKGVRAVAIRDGKLVLEKGGGKPSDDHSSGRLPGTKPLTEQGDLAARMVAGIDRHLMRELAAAPERRRSLWKPDYSSPEAYAKSVAPNREHLRRIIGAVDQRLPVKELEYVATTSTKPVVAETDAYTAYAVRWPVFEGVDAEGLLLEPRGKPVGCVVALPDADWTPEMIAGLAAGVPRESQFGRRLAENGCRVLVPTLIDRKDTWSGSPRFRFTNQPHREFIYRMAYELGRHIIGYEVQKVLAAVDYFTQDKDHPPLGVFGYGEGGLLALYSAALDPRIQTTVVSGYFGPREAVWKEPIYRNVWALLHEFGDAELADLVAPRTLIVECSKGPEVSGPPPARDGRTGAAPGRLVTKDNAEVFTEARRAEAYRRLNVPDDRGLLVRAVRARRPGNANTLSAFLHALANRDPLKSNEVPAEDLRKNFDPAAREHRQFDQLVNFTQRLLRESENRRREFWSRVDLSSLDAYRKSCAFYRNYFWEEVIGKLPEPALPANPRSRLTYDEPRWKGYEVMLDVYPDVFAYGILLVPRDLKPGERRPLVVCQHGLEGRPVDAVNPKVKTPYYNSFGAQLADRGYIVYAPQNPYIGENDFRMLQRKANPLKLSLFSFIVRQHERTLDWLAGLPFVDPQRMGFYGLSYGGKTAMRVPAILPRYALSICSGDFNEWIWKNITLDFTGSYMMTREWEMYEFDLGNTFNYAEMAALIAPRPFMVERGHDDGVGIDEQVAYEYAKVRRLYAKLGIPDRTAIEFFSGGHMINGKGTFAFLDRHLNFHPPAEQRRASAR